MRPLIHNGIRHPTAVELHEKVGSALRDAGHEATVCHGVVEQALEPFDVLVSNAVVPAEVRVRLPCYGGIVLPRPGSMALLELAGLDCMRWTTAASEQEVVDLFDRWDVDRLLLKRSFTHGGDGVVVFDRESIEGVEWDRHQDVFCAEVAADAGDVYKAEMFNGELLLAWVSEAPPLQTLWDGAPIDGVRGAYGDRRLHEFPGDVAADLGRASALLTRLGIGHVSIDLMRAADGSYRVIELNLSLIATWWTVQFDQFVRRYAAAIADLGAVGAGAPVPGPIAS